MLDLILNAISSKEKDELITNGSKMLGIPSNKAENAMGSAAAILMNALQRNSNNSDGRQSLENALNRDHDGSVLDNIGSLLSNPSSGSGAGILRHILGNKQSMIESFLSKENGISKSSSSNLLKMVAPIVMGMIGKQFKSQRGSRSNVNSLLSMLTGSMEKQAPKNQSMIEQLLDSDGDGSIIDDIANIGMSFLKNKR